MGGPVTFAYGYDRPTSQYFLDVKADEEMGFVSVVGFDGVMSGTRGNLIRKIDFYEIADMIPESHMLAICMDLPIPEQDEPDPDGDRDYPGPRLPRLRLNRVPFVHKSEGPDAERFNAMQD